MGKSVQNGFNKPFRKVSYKPTIEISPPNQTIVKLIALFLAVPTNTPEANLNVISISDNNGGRILL